MARPEHTQLDCDSDARLDKDFEQREEKNSFEFVRYHLHWVLCEETELKKEGDEGLLSVADTDVLPFFVPPLKYPFLLFTKPTNPASSKTCGVHESPHNQLRFHLRAPQNYGCGSGA